MLSLLFLHKVNTFEASTVFETDSDIHDQNFQDFTRTDGPRYMREIGTKEIT